ncbi:unnamed protein product, partial [Leptidea sinapis]
VLIYITTTNMSTVHRTYPEWYVGGAVAGTVRQRGRRDVTVDRKVGDNGKVFGTLGANDNGLFIFDDARGKLSGQVSGSRVLGPMGDASLVNGGLRYENSNAQASLDITMQIHGHTMQNQFIDRAIVLEHTHVTRDDWSEILLATALVEVTEYDGRQLIIFR